jgi:hypothetical protein
VLNKLKRDDVMTHEKEEELQKLKEELEWVKYRIKMLDIMERKLFEMRKIAESAQNNISVEEREQLNKKIKSLQSQINGVDGESRHE